MKRICLITAILLCACHPPRPHGGGVVSPVNIVPPAGPTPTPVQEPMGPTATPEPRESIKETIEPQREPRKDIGAVVTSLNGELQDAFFDYDRSDPRPDGMAALRHDADLLHVALADFPQLKIIVEGHCDERGSAEYNLGLGARRANRAADLLREFGGQLLLQTITYGKEAPQCTEPNESCWQRNRRAHLTVSAP